MTQFTTYLSASYSLGLHRKTVILIQTQVAWLLKHSQCTRFINFCRKETVQKLLDQLLNTRIGPRVITMRTIQNYLLSLENFISFLLEYPKVRQSISRKSLLKFPKDVRKMTKAIGRQARRKVWQRLQPTTVQIKAYRHSNLRKTMIADILSLPRPDATKYDPSTYVKILGLLGLEISLDNANRPGEIMNMTIEDFEQRLVNNGNIKLIEILPHKTLLSQGPAFISLTAELEKLLLKYLNHIRPAVQRSDSTSFFS